MHKTYRFEEYSPPLLQFAKQYFARDQIVVRVYNSNFFLFNALQLIFSHQYLHPLPG